MTNPTTPFSWQMPTASDLVTDLPADFETFGQAVATSMADLLGGTTGQILAKATNADMDFTWITNDIGDITGITASSPLTGGGTSGAVTVGIQDGTTAQKGAVQLENSTSSTSTTTAAVPAAVKSAYDLANGAIAKSLVDAKGDLIVATADNTVTRLASSAVNDQVLTVDTSTATGLKWAAPASGFTYATYTPSFTDLTIGNATVVARYAQSGKAVNVFIDVRFGSTTSITGTGPTFTLPVTAASTAHPSHQAGAIIDAGTRYYTAGAEINGTTTVRLNFMESYGGYIGYRSVTSTLPMTWTTNDGFQLNFTYEAA